MESTATTFPQLLPVIGSVLGIMSAAVVLSWKFFDARLAALKEQVESGNKKIEHIEREMAEIRSERNSLRSEVEMNRTMRIEALEELREAHKSIDRLQARLNFYEQRGHGNQHHES